MAKYAAFLRAINVGGHLVKSSVLISHVTAIGYENVATFRASGNVIFAAPDADASDQISARIEAALQDAFGYAVPVYLRTEAQVRGIARYEPFPAALVEASAGKLQVAFMAGSPKPSIRAQVEAMATDQDRMAFHGSELYWLPSGRMMDTALDLRALEKTLGSWTMRTKGTVDQIAARYFAS